MVQEAQIHPLAKQKKMNPTLKYLLKKWLLLIAVSVASCFVLVLLWYKVPDDPVDAEFRRMLIVTSLLVSLLMCLSAGTMLLNYAKRIRESRVSRWLSFFLSPIITLLSSFNPSGKDVFQGLVSYPPIMVPFFIWLTLTYIFFLKWIKKNEDLLT